jgi:hypothetical protein
MIRASVGAVAAEQSVLAKQPEIAGAGNSLARRIRLDVGGTGNTAPDAKLARRRFFRLRRALRATPTGLSLSFAPGLRDR